MPSFLTYETNQIIINDNLFPANSVNIQLSASTVPVKDILGNVLYYSPTEPIKGSFSVNFFLTGELPSYLRLENQTEIPTKFAFNKILIPDCHLTNLSLSVRPFEPIPVKADFVFYHGIVSLATDPTIINSQSQKLFSKYVNFVNQSFATGLNILNGMSSYILTDDRSTWVENPTDFVVTDFDYQFSVQRVPVLRVGEQFPQRVAMKEIDAEFNITTNNIDGVLDIHGNSAVFQATLRDNTNLNVSTNFNLTGIITDQSYEIAEDNYGFSKIKMVQSLNRKRNLITIPMEVSDPLIVTAPTNNPIIEPEPIVTKTPTTIEIPGTNVITNPIEKGSTGGEIKQTDKDEYIYYFIPFDLNLYSLNNNQPPIIEESLVKIPLFRNFVYNDLYLKFDISRQPNKENILKRESLNSDNPNVFFRLSDALGVVFKINENFQNFFGSTPQYNDNISDPFFEFSFRPVFDLTRNTSIVYTYNDVWDLLVGTPSEGDGTINKPYIIQDNNKKTIYFAGNNN